MKKRIITLLLVTITLFSCDVTKELSGAYNMINCQYSYKSISGFTVSGMNLSNGVSPLYIPKLTSILTGSATSIPVDFTLNLNVKNPNQSEALLHGLQYIVSIDDIKFTSGTLNKSLNIPSGETQTLPLTIGIDLASLMKNNSKEAITDIAKNFIGIGSKKSNVTVQVKPTFLIGNTPVTSPTYIPVNFSFGGN